MNRDALYIGIGIGAVLVVAWLIERGITSLPAAGKAINDAANKVFRGATGDDVNSIGTKIYEWTHPGAGEDITAPTPIPKQYQAQPGTW